ncbi:MAG: class I SAM-dependent methyltransferase [bacterium]
MNCKICNNTCRCLFSANLLLKYDVKYYLCENCGFLQTEEPYWLNEAYTETINSTDTGLLQRNITLARQITPILYYFFDKNAKFLDWAGGYGIFTRLMRDIGFDFYWGDPYCKNLFARGFEYNSEIHDITLVTTFESFEHFTNPITEIQKMLSVSKNIIFTTNLLPEKVPAPEDWWYYGLEHGQHISFYSKKTLEFIAGKFGINLLSADGLNIFSGKPLNKLYANILLGKRGGLPRRYFAKYLLNKCLKKLPSKTETDMKYLIAEAEHREP